MAQVRALNWGRILIAIIVGEALPLLALIAIVHFTLPTDPAAVDAYARHMGTFVGPIGGFVTVAMMSWWAGWRSASPVVQGALIGGILALIDLVIVVAMAEPFGWLWFVSNGGKIVAGMLGGRLVLKR